MLNAICVKETKRDLLTHYVIVRNDMPKGLQMAQVVHAAGESSPGNLPSGCYAIVLAATPDQLEEYEELLADAQVPFRSIRENEGPYAGQITAIGVRPERRSKLRKYFSSLPLLK